jgi:soluble lytic murein transglycosylase
VQALEGLFVMTGHIGSAISVVLSVFCLSALFLKSEPLFASDDLSDGLSQDEEEVFLGVTLSEPVFVKPPRTLSYVLSEKTSGLSHETFSSEELSQLWANARLYVEFRKGQLSAQKKAAVLGECLALGNQNPFCPLYQRDWEKNWFAAEHAEAQSDLSEGSDESAETSGYVWMNPWDMAAELREGKLEMTQQATSSAIFRSMRQFGDWSLLEPAYQAVRASRSCPRTSFLIALGMKAEEYFPDPSMKEISIDLYERAIECEKKYKETADRARYRLGLLHVWNEQCSKADPLLGVLAEREGSEFRTRALYWQGHCADQMGDALKLAVIQNKMLQHNPIAFHSLALNQHRAEEIVSWTRKSDPKLSFRSEKRPILNSFVLATELLQELNANRYASELIQFLRRQARNEEPNFRLYLAVLADRSSDAILRFQILSTVFTDDPTLVSEQSLKLFYPNERRATILQHGNSVDPNLTLALIRQESAFNPNARSRAGALGLMQLMPNTARRFGRVTNQQILQPTRNIQLGTRYFRMLLQRYDGDAELALAAYNAGSNAVDGWLKRYTMEDRILFIDMIPFAETRSYVSLIARNYFWYNHLYPGAASEKTAPDAQQKSSRRLASADEPMIFRTLNSL